MFWKFIHSPLYQEGTGTEGGGGDGTPAAPVAPASPTDVPPSEPKALPPEAPPARAKPPSFRDILGKEEPKPVPGQPEPESNTPKPASAAPAAPAEPKTGVEEKPPVGDAKPTEPESGAEPEPTEPDEFEWDDEETAPDEEGKPKAAKPATPSELNTDEEEQKAIRELEAEMQREGASDEDLVAKALRTNRGKRMRAAFKYKGDLEAALGRRTGDAPSIEDVKKMADRDQSFQAMLHDVNMAELEPDSPNLDRFLDFWYGSGQDGKPRPGAVSIASKLPEFLFEKSPDVFNAMARPVLLRYIDYLYEKGNGTADDGQRKYLLRTAVGLDYALTGKYRTIDQENAVAKPPTKTDEELRIEEIERENRDRESRMIQEQWNTYQGSLNEAIVGMLGQDADKALGARKSTLDERTYNAVRRDFIQETVNTVTGSPDFQRELNRFLDLDRANMKRGRLNPTASIARVIQFYRPRSRRAMETLRGDFLKGTAQASVNGAKSQADREREVRQAARTQVSPNASDSQGVNVAAAQPKLERGKTEDLESFQKRQFKGMLEAETL